MMKWLIKNFIKISGKIFNILPKFLANIIAKFYLKIHKMKDNIFFDNEYLGSDKNLIYMDYDNAVGDVIVLIRTLYKLNEEGEKFDILIHEKFKGVIEKFGFSNINIIYKKNDAGKHYDKKLNDNYMDIFSESKNRKLSYKNVYFFCIKINIDPMLYISQINYEKLILMRNIYIDQKFVRKVKNNYWFSIRNLKLSFWFFLNKEKFKYEFIGSKDQRKLFLADYAYFIYKGHIPSETLSSIILSNPFNKYNENKSIGIITSKLPREKILKEENTIELLEKYNNNNKNVYIFGDSNIQAENIEKLSCDYKIINMVNKTSTILEFIEAVNMCDIVITPDTSLLHISMLLNKDTILYVNKKSKIYKYEKYVWLLYKRENLKMILLDSKNFLKE